MKFLIDECMHTSLVGLAHAAGHAADHVNYIGLGGLKDRELMLVILEQDYTLVTNNRVDFLKLHGNAPLHAGLIVIIPNVAPAKQRVLFSAALNCIGNTEMINKVLEVDFHELQPRCEEYSLS